MTKLEDAKSPSHQTPFEVENSKQPSVYFNFVLSDNEKFIEEQEMLNFQVIQKNKKKK